MDSVLKSRRPTAHSWFCSSSTAPASRSNELRLEKMPTASLGRPVPQGATSDKIYVTNLYNLAMPLIRYEITDQVRWLDEPCSERAGIVFEPALKPG